MLQEDGDQKTLDKKAADLLATAITEVFGRTTTAATRIASCEDFDAELKRLLEHFESDDLHEIHSHVPLANETAKRLLEWYAEKVADLLRERPGNDWLSDTDFEFESAWKESKYQIQQEPLSGFDYAREFVYDDCHKVLSLTSVQRRKVLWSFTPCSTVGAFSDFEEDFDHEFPFDCTPELTERVYDAVCTLAGNEPLEDDPTVPEWPSNCYGFWQEEESGIADGIAAIRTLLGRPCLASHELSALGLILWLLERFPERTRGIMVNVVFHNGNARFDENAMSSLIINKDLVTFEFSDKGSTCGLIELVGSLRGQISRRRALVRLVQTLPSMARPRPG